jgi:thiol-disulfide isomerase/thioredoxin
MNKNTGIVLGIIVLAVVAGGIYASTSKKDDAMTAKEAMEQKAMEDTKMAEEKAMMEKRAMEEKETMMKDAAAETDVMMKKDETSMTDTGDVMMSAGSYETYAPEKITLASLSHDVVLFFRASWCPSCKAVDADIRAHLKEIPSDLTILDVNYDDSASLKQKYAVTYQHTFVQVDSEGNLIKKWSGSPTLSTIVAEVE